jgi:hypothetical protein
MRACFECDTHTWQAIEPCGKRLSREFDAALVDDLTMVIQHAQVSPSITQVQSNRDLTPPPCSTSESFAPVSALADLLFDGIYQVASTAACSFHLDRGHAVPQDGTAA